MRYRLLILMAASTAVVAGCKPQTETPTPVNRQPPPSHTVISDSAEQKSVNTPEPAPARVAQTPAEGPTASILAGEWDGTTRKGSEIHLSMRPDGAFELRNNKQTIDASTFPNSTIRWVADADAEPKRFDITISGAKPTITIPGIYKIQDDGQLIIRLGAPVQSAPFGRPTWEDAPDKGMWLTLKRGNPTS